MRVLLLAALRRAGGFAPARTARARMAAAAVEVASDDADARSEFGTKFYWDELYEGRGDFAADAYSWYCGFDAIRPVWEAHAPAKSGGGRVLLPGVGNDSTPRDLWRAGWRDLFACDYSAAAVARQRDLNWDCAGLACHEADARALPLGDGSCAAALEKGALDAVYLAGDGQVERAAAELARVVAVGGAVVSVSGVVPPDVRAACFPRETWDWLRDGSGDLAAGCFVFRRR